MSRERRELLEAVQRSLAAAKEETGGAIDDVTSFKSALSAADALAHEVNALAAERKALERKLTSVLEALPAKSGDGLYLGHVLRAWPVFSAVLACALVFSAHVEPLWLLGPVTVVTSWLCARDQNARL